MTGGDRAGCGGLWLEEGDRYPSNDPLGPRESLGGDCQPPCCGWGSTCRHWLVDCCCWLPPWLLRLSIDTLEGCLGGRLSLGKLPLISWEDDALLLPFRDTAPPAALEEGWGIRDGCWIFEVLGLLPPPPRGCWSLVEWALLVRETASCCLGFCALAVATLLRAASTPACTFLLFSSSVSSGAWCSSC